MALQWYCSSWYEIHCLHWPICNPTLTITRLQYLQKCWTLDSGLWTLDRTRGLDYGLIFGLEQRFYLLCEYWNVFFNWQQVTWDLGYSVLRMVQEDRVSIHKYLRPCNAEPHPQPLCCCMNIDYTDRQNVPTCCCALSRYHAINYWLSRFVLEACREDGQPYPPTSISNLLAGLHRKRQYQVSLCKEVD